jgi:hypothetical protein
MGSSTICTVLLISDSCEVLFFDLGDREGLSKIDFISESAIDSSISKKNGSSCESG